MKGDLDVMRSSLLAASLLFALGSVSLNLQDTHVLFAQDTDDEAEAEEYMEEEQLEIEDLMDEGGYELETSELLPIWTVPEQYRLQLHISFGKQSMTVRRFVSGERIRSEIETEQRQTILIELGDPGGTVYELLPAEQQALRVLMGKYARVLGSRELGAGLDDQAVEYLGEDRTAGRRSLEYSIAEAEGPVVAWFDVSSGAPLRMETERAGVPYVIEWRNLNIKKQPDDLFEIPEGFTVREVEVPQAIEDRQATSIVGQLSEEQVASIDGVSVHEDWELLLHTPVEKAGSAGGRPFGGPLGAVAGEYIPGWLGTILAGAAAGR